MADVTSVGTERPICPQCSFRYEIVTGLAVVGGTGLVAGEGVPTRLAPGYELLLATGPDPRVATVCFPLAGGAVPVADGSLTAVMRAMGRDGPGEVVAVHDLSTGQRFSVADPGNHAAGRAVAGGVSVGFIFFLVVGLLGLNLALAFTAALFVGAGVFAWVRHRDGPRARLSETARGALQHKRRLLERKLELERTIHALHGEREQKTALQARLGRLAAKMEEVGVELYGARLATVEAGLRTLEQQMAVDDRLVAGYTRTIKIIEIELESHAGADLLPDDPGGALAAGEAELDALAAEHRELASQLAANDEVERLLRSG